MPRFEILEDEPFAGGQDFGAGPYRRIAGRFHGAIDPADARHAAIADLDLAPRNAAGLVEYATEIVILRPADPARGNGRLLYDVTNRGRKVVFGAFFEATGATAAEQNALRSAAAAGRATPLREGTTLAWSGWDPEVPRGNDTLRIDLPLLPGIVGTSRDEWVFGTRVMPADRPTAPLSYPVADRDKARARLVVRRTRDGAPRAIPPDAWDYAGERAIRLLPEGTAFEPGSIYDFIYPATGARPLGAAFAATRDLVAALRHGEGEGNPLAGLAIRHTYAAGVSQAGRYLRQHIDLGMNADTRGRRVFDGVLSHVAGAGRVFINQRFAQPDRTACWHEDRDFPEVWFPMAAAAATDPLSGRTDALLRNPATDPLLMEVNTSTEYWQKGASLTHTDPAGMRDLPEPDGARLYLCAGTRHAGRAGATTARGFAHNLNNPHSASPLLRALLAALQDWVERGMAPPPSAVPRIADGTLVPASDVLGAFPTLPGARLPRFANPIAAVTDWVAGTRTAEDAWRPLVPAVDADGNECCGVRLPGVAVPRGTCTGWNLYAAPGLEGELADREGSMLPFAATRAEREAAGDPRPSIEERWPTETDHAAAVAAAAAALVARRLLLEEDAAGLVAAAGRRPPW